MMPKPYKILLTGAHGMVGKNILEHPGFSQWEMLAPRRSELDLLNYAATLSYLRNLKPDIVIHAAGKVGGIQANLREPVAFLRDNMDMGRNIVLAAREVGVRTLLNLGSSCMYPRNHSEPLREEQLLTGELEPTNEGYALAKIVTARLCEYISREDASYQYKTLIPCNIYGRHDKFDPSHSHLVPAAIHKIHTAKSRGEESVEIWGDGTARREFLYAGDLAAAVIMAVTNFDSLPVYMNIGLGHDYSINDYYEAAALVIGYSGSFSHDISKPVGMTRKLVSVERQSAWGWSAQHTLREGIEQTYRHYLEVQQS